MKKTYIAAMLAFSALAATSAQAASLEKEAIYIGAGASYSAFDVDGVSGLDKTDTGLNLNIGYKFNSTFSAELGYSKLGDIKIPTEAGEFSVRNSMVSLSAIGKYPATKEIDILGRVGIAETTSKLAGMKDRTVSPILGIGAEYKLTPNYALRAEVQYLPKFGSSDVSLVNTTFGLQAQF